MIMNIASVCSTWSLRASSLVWKTLASLERA